MTPPFEMQAALLKAAADVRRLVVQPDIGPNSPQAADRDAAIAAGRGDIMDRVVIVADLWTLVASEQMKAAGGDDRGEEDPGPVLIGLSPLLRSAGR